MLHDKSTTFLSELKNYFSSNEKSVQTLFTELCSLKISDRQITAELLETKITVTGENTCLCPKCKTAQVRFYPRVAKCTDVNCGLVVFRNISKKPLSDGLITDLLTKGKTTVIKGFKSQAGKTFDAALKFDENYRVTYNFPAKKAGKEKK
jgi:DNA topoisomerase-3